MPFENEPKPAEKRKGLGLVAGLIIFMAAAIFVGYMIWYLSLS